MSGPVRAIRRVAVTVVGSVVLVAGALMLVLPGPGLLGVAAGLAILATEYHWARRYVHRVRERAHQVSQLSAASPRNTVGAVLFAVLLAGAGVVLLVSPDLLPVGGTAAGVGLVVGGVVICLGTVLGYRERRLALRGAGRPSDRERV
ncbi:PGPGW domain-containing protein [Thalassiella azotivora]